MTTESTSEEPHPPERTIDPTLQRVREQFEEHHERIDALARLAHRRLRGHLFEDAVSETIGWVWKSFLSLTNRGEDPVPLIPNLVRFAAGHVRAGKLLGRSESRDALSRFAREEGGYEVNSIPICEDEPAAPELIDELGRRSEDPANEATWNVDYQDWLSTLSSPQRDVALALASGLNPSEVARERGVSKASVQQIQDRLDRKWDEFHGGHSR